MVSSSEASRLNSQRLKIQASLEIYYDHQETNNPVPESEIFDDLAICNFLNARQAHYAAAQNSEMEFFYMGLIDVGNRAVRRDMVFLMTTCEALGDQSLCAMERELYDLIMGTVASEEAVSNMTSPGVSSESVKGGTSESTRTRRVVSLPDRLPPGGGIQSAEFNEEEIPTAYYLRNRIIAFYAEHLDGPTDECSEWILAPESPMKEVIRGFIGNRVMFYEALGDVAMERLFMVMLEMCDTCTPIFETLDILMEKRRECQSEEQKCLIDRQCYQSIMNDIYPIPFNE